jgi:hypothetical protein
MKDYCLELVSNKQNIDEKINVMREYGKKLRSIVSERIWGADWKKIESDVKNFLERPSDFSVFTKESLLSLIS